MISAGEGRAGGLENVVYELSGFLAKHNVEVTILQESSKNSTKLFQNCKVEGLRPFPILPNKLRFAFYEKYAYSLKVYQRIRQLGYFDIIHGHGDNCFFPALLRDQTPFVASIHGIKKAYRSIVFGPNSRVIKSPRYFPLYWPEEVAAKRSNILVTDSKAERDDLISFYGIDPAKIKVIYPGVDSARFKPMNKQVARKILGLPENKKYGIWVGNNPTMKGLATAIRAVKGVKNLYLLVVGISANNFENVIFRGMVQDFHLFPAHYNAADFFIFPTRFEGFGLVALEAMACGLPIIISKECPAKEIIRDGVEGFVIDQRRPECYTEKIVTLLTEDSTYQEISLRCRKLAEKFSWENSGRECLKVYSQVTSA